MHIPDGLITPEIAALMYAMSIAFLAWSWRKAKATYERSLAPILAVSSAFVFVAQMINFPIAYGTSGHLVGGTFLAVLLGPYAAALGMTVVLLMQALFFADGGIMALGANIFNMAVIGALSSFIIKYLTKDASNRGMFFASVFVASWLSVALGALACAMEISPAFSNVGGIAATVPAMLFWHVLIGLGEAAITTTLTTQLWRLQPTALSGLKVLRRGEHAGLP